jgi:squalene-hopene/tetraprenyl-beta-curcumene cyclase
MNRVSRCVALLTLAAALPAGRSAAQSTALVSAQPPAGVLPVSMENERQAAVRRSCDWLVANQRADGSWSDTNYPALSALPLWALIRSGDPSRKPAIDKAVKNLRGYVQPDGGIYRDVPGKKGGGLSNYNTAICMTALFESGDKTLVPIILKAREFVAASQHFGDDVYSGGFGYDGATGRAYTDLLNTFYSIQALRITAAAEDSRPTGSKQADIDWDAAIKFIERMQNAGDAAGTNKGGFFYNPTDATKGGTTTNAQGAVAFRSYGSMTYSGMLALIYSHVSRDDYRVRSAFDWAAANWSIDENPGMGQQGLYFFYEILSRSLSASGRDLIPRAGAEPVNWRVAVAGKIISLQKVDPKGGYWINENNRFWENDPVLVSSYALLALESL